MIYFKAKRRANKMSVEKKCDFHVIKRKFKFLKLSTWFGINYTYVTDWYINHESIENIIYTSKF